MSPTTCWKRPASELASLSMDSGVSAAPAARPAEEEDEGGAAAGLGSGAACAGADDETVADVVDATDVMFRSLGS